MVGVGLLGGSLGLAVKAVDETVRVVGVGRRRSSLAKALACGAIDRATLDAAEGVEGSELVVLATPLGVYEEHLLAMAESLSPKAAVTDVGSTKSIVVRLAEDVLGRGGAFVGSHPMAGGERRGVEFARADLFVGAACIVTPTRHTPDKHLRRVEGLWRALGGLTTRMSPAQHDRAVAQVSHLPHVLAALIVTGQRTGDLHLAGKGFLDTTRIASGEPAMWREILLTNRKAVLAAIDATDEHLAHLRDLLELGDATGIERFLTRAKQRRDNLVAQGIRRGN